MKEKIDKDDIYKMLNQGDLYQDICNKYGLSIGQVTRMAKEWGIRRSRGRPRDIGWFEAAMEYYNKGMSQAKVAKEMNLSRQAISSMFKRYGVVWKRDKKKGDGNEV